MKAFHRSLNPIVDRQASSLVSIRRHDRDLHKGDLDKGSCTRDRKASLKSRCDSQGAAAASVGFSLLRRDARVGGSCPFQRSVPQSRATTHKLLFRCILSSVLTRLRPGIMQRQVSCIWRARSHWAITSRRSGSRMSAPYRSINVCL